MRVDGNDIFVKDSGEEGKPALLFIHGIMMDHSVWSNQVEAFKDSYRTVAVDLRGFGRSTAASPIISFEDHADDLAQLIDQLGLRNVTLIGWSMGGAVALVFAHRHQMKIRRLVLVDTTPQLLADDRFSEAISPVAAQELGSVLTSDFATGCAAFCEMISPESAEVALQLSTIAAATPVDVAMNAFRSSGVRSLLDHLPQIELPTFVLCGELDTICPPAASKYMASAISGCKVPAAIIADAGHAPFLTRPAAFNATLSQMLAHS